MIEPVPQKRGFFSRFRKKAMIAVVLFSFLAGYMTVSARQQICAQNSINDWSEDDEYTINTSVCSVGICYPQLSVVLCVGWGQGALMAAMVWGVTKEQLEKNAERLEQYIYKQVEGVVEAALFRINTIEIRMMEWWDSMWANGLLPSMKLMTTQLTTGLASQTKMITLMTDAQRTVGGGGGPATASRANGGILATQRIEVDDRRTFNVDDNACATATVSGGLGRATAFSKAMRKGWQKKAIDAGSSVRGTAGASGRAAYARARNDTFRAVFCNPLDNAGKNDCTSADPQFFNADTQVTKTIYNKLTIPVDGPNGELHSAAVEEVIENLTGSTAAEPIEPTAMMTPQGQEKWLNRRSFLARHAAIRSVPQLIASWRMPGSGPEIARWVKELRQGRPGDVPMLPDEELSENPSYREIMHALTIDRPNSAAYAQGLITEKSNIEIEKLTLSTFHLMQLRDYFELLERTALSLAVQVAMGADEITVNNPPPRTK